MPVEDDDNDDMTMLPDSLFINLIDTKLQKRIALCNTMDKDAIDALSTLLEEPNVTRNELEDWTLEKFNGKNILFFKGKNYIPRDEELRKDIVRTFHDNQMAGHPGELEMFYSL